MQMNLYRMVFQGFHLTDQSINPSTCGYPKGSNYILLYMDEMAYVVQLQYWPNTIIAGKLWKQWAGGVE